ncbi:unnamed protein product [Effrenium voratum]|nr:unnamed protein product [Effrenium voratum]
MCADVSSSQQVEETDAEAPERERDLSEPCAARPRKPPPRRTVFQRLSQARLCRWQVGDRVWVRDRTEKDALHERARPAEQDWKPGTVVSLEPVKVRLRGGTEGFTWRDIKERPRSSSPSPEQSCRPRCRSPARPASVEAVRRARTLSRRRRGREKEARRKETEQMRFSANSFRPKRSASLPRAAEQKELEQVKKVRDAIDEIRHQLREEPRKGRRPPSPGLGPGPAALKVLKLSRGLKGFGFQLNDLRQLTTKERKELLRDLLHPHPEGALQEELFFEWMHQQLQSLRLQRQTRSRLPEVASLRADTTTVLELVRSCVSHAVEADDRRSLPRLAKAIRIAHLQLEHLDCLPLKEFKQLSEKLNVRMTGMTKEEVIQKLRKQLWSRRAQASAAPLPELCTYPRAEAISLVRKALKKAQEQLEKPVPSWQLSRWLWLFELGLEDLGCLCPEELRKLEEWLEMPPLRSKPEILEWLRKEVWFDRAVRRTPSSSQIRVMEELSAPANPARAIAPDFREDPEDTLTLMDEDDFIMEYDMFVPP